MSFLFLSFLSFILSFFPFSLFLTFVLIFFLIYLFISIFPALFHSLNIIFSSFLSLVFTVLFFREFIDMWLVNFFLFLNLTYLLLSLFFSYNLFWFNHQVFFSKINLILSPYLNFLKCSQPGPFFVSFWKYSRCTGLCKSYACPLFRLCTNDEVTLKGEQAVSFDYHLGDPHVAALSALADDLRADQVGVGGLQVVQVGVHVIHRVVLCPRHRVI